MMDEFRKAIKEQKMVYGTNATMRNLKNGKTKVVFLASNCSDEVKKDIERYSKLADVKVYELDIPDSEIGMLCKRVHSVSVISY